MVNGNSKEMVISSLCTMVSLLRYISPCSMFAHDVIVEVCCITSAAVRGEQSGAHGERTFYTASAIWYANSSLDILSRT